MSIERVAPPAPAPRHIKYDWYQLATTARTSPGDWFRMPVKSRVYGSYIREGRYAAFPDPENWDVTTRKENDQVYVYVCYNNHQPT